MADTVSEKELETKRDKVNRLREQIAAEEEKSSTRRAEQERSIEAAQLDAEAARLELQLHEAKQAAKVTSVRQATDGLVGSAKEQMKQAEAQLAAAKGDGAPGAETANAPTPPAAEEKATASSTNTDKE